jgi:hypothetical protein
MDNLQQLKQMADAQLQSLDSAMKLADNAIRNSGISPAQLASAQNDMNKIKQGLAKGDPSGISSLLSKYADINNK